ncbi:MAG: bifunctional riboflavin kinase/FAD synthetase [Bdellovibrionota bacterium]
MSNKTALTIGNFDGVHRGHRVLLERIRKFRESHAAKGLKTCVLTFDPHPAEILRPEMPLLKLTSTTERVKLIKDCGIDEVRVIAFTKEFSKTPARDFFENVLIRDLDPALVVVGHNFFFGHQRSGTPGKVLDWCEEIGIQAEVVGPVEADGEEISSSRIRRLLQEGHVQSASRLLGRDFSYTGEVVHGAARGRTIGIPTANIKPEAGRCLPKNGVYVTVSSTHDGRTFPSITNVGVKPTIAGGNHELSLETHLLDFEGDLYGNHLTVEFRDRVRDEKRFSSIQELSEQIHKDIAFARERLDTI